MFNGMNEFQIRFLNDTCLYELRRGDIYSEMQCQIVQLQNVTYAKIPRHNIDYCPSCKGVWLDRGSR